MHSFSRVSALLLVSGLLAGVARAIPDAANDWYSLSDPSTHVARLDVLSADGTYSDGVGWEVTATMAGDIDPSQPSQYVWGFNRGAGAPSFTNENAVLFDSVLSILPGAGTATVRTLGPGGTATNLAAGTFGWDGANIFAFIPEALLPSAGFDDDDYTWNLWPRLPGGTQTSIADFAPDNAMQPFTTVPEPSTFGLIFAGLVPALTLLRKRR